MKGLKLYLIALFFSITWWTANRVLDVFTFSVPVTLKINIENNEFRFLKDTTVQIDLSAKGYEWVRLSGRDTVHFLIADEGLNIQKNNDILFVKITASVLQRKVDSVLGKGFTLASATSITLRDTFCLRKKVHLVLPGILHQIKGCFLCSSPVVEPSTVMLEGKPSVIEQIDSILLKYTPVTLTECRNMVVRMSLPDIHGAKYMSLTQPVCVVKLPFCFYKHFSVDRFYRFEFEQRVYEGTVHIEGFMPPDYSLDSIQVVVDVKNSGHAFFKLKNSSAFKEVEITPAEIELK